MAGMFVAATLAAIRRQCDVSPKVSHEMKKVAEAIRD
jgi:hypothetical protein